MTGWLAGPCSLAILLPLQRSEELDRLFSLADDDRSGKVTADPYPLSRRSVSPLAAQSSHRHTHTHISSNPLSLIRPAK